MNRLFVLVAALMFWVGPGCGGDTQESIAAEGMTKMKEVVATLETVKDAATAKAAKPKLQALLADMKQLNERRAKLPQPTEAETKAMLSKHGPEMEELQKKLVAVALKVQFDPAIQAELGDLDMKAMQ